MAANPGKMRRLSLARLTELPELASACCSETRGNGRARGVSEPAPPMMSAVSGVGRQLSEHGAGCELFLDCDLPEVPSNGAVVKVHYAGACVMAEACGTPKTPISPNLVRGFHSTSIFEGYEVSGVVTAVGENVSAGDDVVLVGDRVIVFPYDGIATDSYSEVMAVPDVRHVVKLPPDLPLEVASLLPCGGLKAFMAVKRAQPVVRHFRRLNQWCSLVIVGSGGMSLLALKLAKKVLGEDSLEVVVAATEEKDTVVALSEKADGAVFWQDSDYDEVIVQKTVSAFSKCKQINLVIDLLSSQPSVQRSLLCLSQEGCLVVGSNSGCDVRVSLSDLARNNKTICGLQPGTVDDLRQLVSIIETNDFPVYSVYPMHKAEEAVRKLSTAQIPGRAVLQLN